MSSKVESPTLRAESARRPSMRSYKESLPLKMLMLRLRAGMELDVYMLLLTLSLTRTYRVRPN